MCIAVTVFDVITLCLGMIPVLGIVGIFLIILISRYRRFGIYKKHRVALQYIYENGPCLLPAEVCNEGIAKALQHALLVHVTKREVPFKQFQHETYYSLHTTRIPEMISCGYITPKGS